MEIAALVTWVLAALGGFWMLGIWLRRRSGSDAAPSRIGPGLILGHFLLAAAGLVLWIVVVVATDVDALTWLALVILLVVALLGFAMFARWWSQRDQPEQPAAPEQHFPVGVVVVHGLFGAVTLVLVLLVALGLG